MKTGSDGYMRLGPIFDLSWRVTVSIRTFWDALLTQSEPDMDALAHILRRVQAASASACGRDA